MVITLLLVNLNSCTDMFRSDIVPPAVFIINPMDGASSLSGNIPIQVKVYDSSPIDYVDFYIDGVRVARVKNEPFTYYWNTNFWQTSSVHRIYVDACDEYGNSTLSAPVEVTLKVSKLEGPQGLYPADNALVSSETVPFRWTSQCNAALYRLEISTTPDMQYLDVVEELADTSIQIHLTRNRYYWRVRAELALDDSVYYSTNYGQTQCMYIGERIFIKQYKWPAQEWGEFIFQQSDSSYRIIATNRIVRVDEIRYQLFLIDTDLLGNQRRTEEYVFFQEPYAAVQSNGKTVIAGYNLSNQATWIALDSSGIVQWQTTLDETSAAKALLVGEAGELYSIAESTTLKDSVSVEFVRMSTDGSIISRQPLFNHSPNSETRWFLAKNTGGGYLLYGDPGNNLQLYLINEDGNIVKRYVYGDESPMQAISVENNNGTIFLFANSLDSVNGDGIIIKVDAAGNELSRNVVGGADRDLFRAVCKTADGGFILTGCTKSGSYGLSDIWIVRLNADGAEIWSRNYGKTMDNTGSGVCQTFDGGYAVVGTIARFDAGINYDTIFLKTDQDGRTIRNWFSE